MAGSGRAPRGGIDGRLIAGIGAVLSAYMAVFAIVCGSPSLAGPMAASFIGCLFCMAPPEEFFHELVEQRAEGDERHVTDGAFLRPARDGNR